MLDGDLIYELPLVSDQQTFETYDLPAGGWGSVRAVATIGIGVISVVHYMVLTEEQRARPMMRTVVDTGAAGF